MKNISLETQGLQTPEMKTKAFFLIFGSTISFVNALKVWRISLVSNIYFDYYH